MGPFPGGKGLFHAYESHFERRTRRVASRISRPPKSANVNLLDAKGDIEGAAAWLRIWTAVLDLGREAPGEGERAQ